MTPRNNSPSRLKQALLTLQPAVVWFIVSSAPAVADLKFCNRMSYVVEAAIEKIFTRP